MKFLPALLLIVPVAASAAIYQWTDERGRVVFGNQVPESGVTNVRTVVKDEPPETVMNANRAAEERIARLERQVQALQSTPPAPYPAPSPYPAPQYSAAPSPDYYYPGMYPAPYYPFGYAYPYGVVRVARPVHRFVGSPRFASVPHASFHHAGMRRR